MVSSFWLSGEDLSHRDGGYVGSMALFYGSSLVLVRTSSYSLESGDLWWVFDWRQVSWCLNGGGVLSLDKQCPLSCPVVRERVPPPEVSHTLKSMFLICCCSVPNTPSICSWF
ncbi:hypothetical protein YC2023_010378 [Brassica napus]